MYIKNKIYCNLDDLLKTKTFDKMQYFYETNFYGAKKLGFWHP